MSAVYCTYGSSSSTTARRNYCSVFIAMSGITKGHKIVANGLRIIFQDVKYRRVKGL